jgi:hypothetical protein
MLDVLTVPATETPTALVVWLHGLGASGNDFVPVVPMMQMPWVHWAFPNAPVQPVTVNGGYRMPSWYDILHMEAGPGRENLDDVRESAAAVDRVIQVSLATHNIPAVVVLGDRRHAPNRRQQAHTHLLWPRSSRCHGSRRPRPSRTRCPARRGSHRFLARLPHGP